MRGMMIPFGRRFPGLAERETRTVTLLSDRNEWNLPKGEYAFIESYCGDRECDCRRVFINVAYLDKSPTAKEKLRTLATIGYGWDTLDYYSKWFGRGKHTSDKEIVRELKGPILELGGVYSEHSENVLKFFKDVMLNDAKFIQRLKKHYKLFKGY